MSARLPPADVSIWWSLVAVETDCTRWHLVGVLASGLQVVELSYNSEGTGWEADHLILGDVPMVYNGVKFGVIESLPRCGKKLSMMVVTAQGASSVVMTQGWQSQSHRAGLTQRRLCGGSP